MARKNRKWFPGAIYHIMAQGNYRQNILFNLHRFISGRNKDLFYR